MLSNIEIKARVDDFEALRARAAEISAAPSQEFRQVDTFFATSRGRLKLREQASGRAQLIYYDRPDQDGPKLSEYDTFRTDNGSSLKALLRRALGVRGEVEKVRYLYMVGQTRVHLDHVRGLGDFMELEVVLRPGQSQEEGRKRNSRKLPAWCKRRWQTPTSWISPSPPKRVMVIIGAR